ncbi:hypothetical protein [Methylobacterium sp. P5_C11]
MHLEIGLTDAATITALAAFTTALASLIGAVANVIWAARRRA